MVRRSARISENKSLKGTTKTILKTTKQKSYGGFQERMPKIKWHVKNTEMDVAQIDQLMKMQCKFINDALI